MKVKILTFVDRKEVGTMVDLHPDEIMHLDDATAQMLIDSGRADYEI